MKTLSQLLGERLTTLREAAGLSEAALADKTHSSRAGVYGIEAGIKNPTLKQFEKLLKGCDVSPEKLFSIKDDDLPENAHSVYWLLVAIAKGPDAEDKLHGLRQMLGPMAEKARNSSEAKGNNAPKEKKKAARKSLQG